MSRRIRERLAELQVGDVADPRTFMGAAIDQAALLPFAGSPEPQLTTPF